MSEKFQVTSLLNEIKVCSFTLPRTLHVSAFRHSLMDFTFRDMIDFMAEPAVVSWSSIREVPNNDTSTSLFHSVYRDLLPVSCILFMPNTFSTVMQPSFHTHRRWRTRSILYSESTLDSFVQRTLCHLCWSLFCNPCSSQKANVFSLNTFHES